MYHIIINDPDPKHGGVTQYGPLPTRKEATWWGEREVLAAAELGIQGVTFQIVACADTPARPRGNAYKVTP